MPSEAVDTPGSNGNFEVFCSLEQRGDERATRQSADQLSRSDIWRE